MSVQPNDDRSPNLRAKKGARSDKATDTTEGILELDHAMARSLGMVLDCALPGLDALRGEVPAKLAPEDAEAFKAEHEALYALASKCAEDLDRKQLRKADLETLILAESDLTHSLRHMFFVGLVEVNNLLNEHRGLDIFDDPFVYGIAEAKSLMALVERLPVVFGELYEKLNGMPHDAEYIPIGDDSSVVLAQVIDALREPLVELAFDFEYGQGTGGADEVVDQEEPEDEGEFAGTELPSDEIRFDTSCEWVDRENSEDQEELEAEIVDSEDSEEAYLELAARWAQCDNDLDQQRLGHTEAALLVDEHEEVTDLLVRKAAAIVHSLEDITRAQIGNLQSPHILEAHMEQCHRSAYCYHSTPNLFIELERAL